MPAYCCGSHWASVSPSVIRWLRMQQQSEWNLLLFCDEMQSVYFSANCTGTAEGHGRLLLVMRCAVYCPWYRTTNNTIDWLRLRPVFVGLKSHNSWVPTASFFKVCWMLTVPRCGRSRMLKPSFLVCFYPCILPNAFPPWRADVLSCVPHSVNTHTTVTRTSEVVLPLEKSKCENAVQISQLWRSLSDALFYFR